MEDKYDLHIKRVAAYLITLFALFFTVVATAGAFAIVAVLWKSL